MVLPDNGFFGAIAGKKSLPTIEVASARRSCIGSPQRRVASRVAEPRALPMREPNEAIVTSGAGTIGRWQVAPWRTRAEDPKDAIEHATVIYPPNAARLVRQHRLDRGPFIIAEFVAHDLKLQFQSLNHIHGNSIKPHKLAAKPLMLWIYLRLRRNSGHGRACHRLRPVANDPSQTLGGLKLLRR